LGWELRVYIELENFPEGSLMMRMTGSTRKVFSIDILIVIHLKMLNKLKMVG